MTASPDARPADALSHDQERAVDRTLAMLPFPDRPRIPLRIRQVRIGFSAVLLCAIGALVAVSATPSIRWAFGWGLTMTLLMVCLAAICVPVVERRAVRRLLKRSGGLICPRCHQPLEMLPERGQCPECGTYYSRELVLGLWRMWYQYPPHGPAGVVQSDAACQRDGSSTV